MSYFDETLMRDEEIIYRAKPHWILFTPAMGWFLLAVLILFLAPRYHLANVPVYKYYTLTDILGLLVLIISLFSALVAFINYQTSEYGITNRRILMKVGLISRLSLEIMLQRVEGIQVYQSILGRLLDYGSVVVIGTGGSRDPFPNIPQPLRFKRYAQEQIDNMHHQGY